MKKKINLPEQLKYLEPAMKKLSRIPPEKFDEMADTDLLAELLLKRIEGLNIQQADLLLYEDKNILEQWIKENPNHHGAADYIFGFLLGSDAQGMRDASQVKPPETIVYAEFPKGFKNKKAGPYGLSAQKKGISITIVYFSQKGTYGHLKRHYTAPVPKEDFPENRVKYQKTLSIINYGQVHGDKILYKQTAPCFWKRVDYLFQKQGGCISVVIDGGGKDFNEMEYESFLGTLEIRKNPNGELRKSGREK